MKIAFISSLYPPEIMGGAEIVVEKIAKELIKRGHQIIVITSSEKFGTEIHNNIKIYRLPLNIYFLQDFPSQNIIKRTIWQLIDLLNIKAYKKIKKILEKETPDIVHIQNYKGLSTLSFKAVKDLNMPLVFTAHDYSPICIRSNLLNGKGQICKEQNLPCEIYNQIQRIFIDNKPDIIIAPSNFVLKKLESRGLFKNVKRIVLPNPIKNTRKRIKKDYDNIDILFVGSLSKHKGPQILIKAFKKNSRKNLRLHILGKGPDEERLKELAKDDKIIFHGFLTGKDLTEMYKIANITVVPSIWYDNSPMVIYESFMHSTPVIASRIGGIPELVKDGYNGFLFEPGNTRELSRILQRIADNPESLKELEDNAFNSVKKYDIKKHTDKLEKIYKSITR